MKINAAKDAGLCEDDMDDTIVEIMFGIKSFDVLNRLIALESLSSEMEILNIKYLRADVKTKENYRKEIMIKQIQL